MCSHIQFFPIVHCFEFKLDRYTISNCPTRADDVTFLAEKQDDLQRGVHLLSEICEKFNIKISETNTRRQNRSTFKDDRGNEHHRKHCYGVMNLSRLSSNLGKKSKTNDCQGFMLLLLSFSPII